MFQAIALIVFFVLSLVMGVLWNLVLFKGNYASVAGDILIENPIFPLGFAAIAVNAVVHLTIFAWVYPQGEPSWARAVLILGTVWGAHFVNTIATAAKYQISDRASFLVLEFGFASLNVLVLATAVWFILGRNTSVAAV